MFEILSWWSFIYGEKGVFREDGNEIMESQQSICYPESQKTPKKTPPNLKGKRSSPNWAQEGKRLHQTRSKGTFAVWLLLHSVKLGLVYLLIRYAWLHSVISASMRWQQTSTDNLLWWKIVNSILQSAVGRGELVEQNRTPLSRATGSQNLLPSLLCWTHSCCH